MGRFRRAVALFALAAVAIPLAQDGGTAWAGPAPGERFRVDAAELPAPYATRSAVNPPRRVDRPAGALPQAPAGFAVELFADGFDHARWLAVAADGTVFLAEPGLGQVTLLRDADGDGRAEVRVPFARGFDSPHGLALRDGYLYVADLARVWRVPWRPGATDPPGRAEPVTPAGSLGDPGGHWTRNLAFHPDGSRFYVAVGSRGNIAEEPAPRATVQEFGADGGGQRTFAAGLRNPVGIVFRPGTAELWVVVNERDGMGDGLVPDYLARIRDGDFFGWPYAYLGPHPQPGFAERRPDLVAKTVAPDLLFRSHSAPLGLVFYDADQFPADYRGDAFVALHGSWNAARPEGYMVARVPFAEGRPRGHYEAFLTGFRTDDSAEGRARVWGRPAGLAVAADGSLLVADDVADAIWRVRWAR